MGSSIPAGGCGGEVSLPCLAGTLHHRSIWHLSLHQPAAVVHDVDLYFFPELFTHSRDIAF